MSVHEITLIEQIKKELLVMFQCSFVIFALVVQGHKFVHFYYKQSIPVNGNILNYRNKANLVIFTTNITKFIKKTKMSYEFMWIFKQ